GAGDVARPCRLIGGPAPPAARTPTVRRRGPTRPVVGPLHALHFHSVRVGKKGSASYHGLPPRSTRSLRGIFPVPLSCCTLAPMLRPSQSMLASSRAARRLSAREDRRKALVRFLRFLFGMGASLCGVVFDLLLLAGTPLAYLAASCALFDLPQGWLSLD